MKKEDQRKEMEDNKDDTTAACNFAVTNKKKQSRADNNVLLSRSSATTGGDDKDSLPPSSKKLKTKKSDAAIPNPTNKTIDSATAKEWLCKTYRYQKLKKILTFESVKKTLEEAGCTFADGAYTVPLGRGKSKMFESLVEYREYLYRNVVTLKGVNDADGMGLLPPGQKVAQIEHSTVRVHQEGYNTRMETEVDDTGILLISEQRELVCPVRSSRKKETESQQIQIRTPFGARGRTPIGCGRIRSVQGGTGSVGILLIVSVSTIETLHVLPNNKPKQNKI